MAPLPRTNSEHEMTAITQPFVDSLLAKISNLEDENRDLRARIQQLESESNGKRLRRPARERLESVVFDGLRTSLHVNKLQQSHDIFPKKDEVQTNWRQCQINRSQTSALSADGGPPEDASEDELSSYIERRFSTSESVATEQSDDITFSESSLKEEIDDTGVNKDSVLRGGMADIVKKVGRELRHKSPKLGENKKNIAASNSDKHGSKQKSSMQDDNVDLKTDGQRSDKNYRRHRSLEDDQSVSDISPFDDSSMKKQISFSLGDRKTNRYLMGSVFQSHGWSLIASKREQAVKNAKDKEEKAKQMKLLNVLSHIGMMSAKTSLTKALGKRSEEGKVRSFENFYLFSLDPKKQYRAGTDLVAAGHCFISPFSTSGLDCVDRFPKQKIENELDPMEISPFCCPDGLKIRMFPRAALSGAKRMGWLGIRADQYKLLVFTDGNGMTKHGIAITVFEEISMDNSEYKGLRETLLENRNMRFAARKLQCWWKRLPRKKSRRASRRNSGFGAARRPSIDIGTSLQSLFSLNPSSKSSNSFMDENLSTASSQFDIFETDLDESFSSAPLPSSLVEESGSLDSAATAPTWPLQWNPKANSDRNQIDDDGGRPRSRSESNFDDSLLGGFMDWSGSYHHEHSASLLGKEAFEIMNASSALGDVIVIEKCYVIIGGSEQYLQLKLLQNMITREREEKSKASSSKVSRKTPKKSLHIPNILHLGRTDIESSFQSKSIIEFRHSYLDALLEGMVLNHEQAKACKNTTKIHSQSELMFEIDLPTFTTETYSFHESLPFPLVADHWGVAALVARVKPKDLLVVLKLLLIERSVLVIGESSHLVTACTCALLQLLKPYQWASNFMPLLPGSMLDFVGSPVPFLIGMTVESQAHSRRLQKDDRVIDAMNSGLSVVNLSTKSVHLTTEPQIVPMLKGCPTPAPQLSRCKRKLENLRKKSPSLRSFVRFIKDGLENHEIATIKETQQLIHTFMTGLSDNIASDPEGWRYYSKHGSGEAYDFYPGLFVDRLKHQMKSLECRVQFQEMMAYSQLFVEFVDGKRKASLEEDMLRRAIGNWIYHKWKLKKMKQTKPRFQAQMLLGRVSV